LQVNAVADLRGDEFIQTSSAVHHYMQE